MKKIKNILAVALAIMLSFTFASCNMLKGEVSLWESASYTENQTFGEGQKTITLEVKAEEKSVEFVLRTNAEFLADALLEHNIISGDEGPYGVYVTHVNGMEADYDKNRSFWSLEKDGLQLTTGVSETGIKDGDRFTLVYKIV